MTSSQVICGLGSPPIKNPGYARGVGNWISVSSPDNFFKHGVNDIDFGKLNYYPLLFNDENDNDEEWLQSAIFCVVIWLVF